ncbi:MAG: hypothetical protein IKX37_01880 [Bacteroidales bacterium]|nr:hypothetical protein [Bacteroidales bacterium]
MKQNHTKDIEKLLTPQCEFHASDNLVNKVMGAAAREVQPAKTGSPGFRWKTVFASAAAVAAMVALFFVVKPEGTPAYAAEKLFARAAEYFTAVDGYVVHFDVRTTGHEQFSYTNPAKGFVGHTMTVASDGRWKLDKGERIAEFDGNNIHVWFPEEEWGWKLDADQTGTIFPFDNLLDLGGLMRWLEQYVAASQGADCRKVEDDETVGLILKVPAQGDYGNDYMKLSSVGDSDTRQTYVFSKKEGRLLSAKIEAKVFGFSRTILRAKSIDYDAAVSESTFALPVNVEWLDDTKETIARRATELPVTEFVGIGPEEAVDKLFKALKEWDEPMLKVILRIYPLSRLEAGGFKGCTLLKKGDAFQSGTYGGVFVPCEILLATGRKIKTKLALRNDNPWRVWEVDGGI